MQEHWMFVTGCAIFGWLVPEFAVMFTRVKVPVGVNVLAMISAALLAASFV